MIEISTIEREMLSYLDSNNITTNDALKFIKELNWNTGQKILKDYSEKLFQYKLQNSIENKDLENQSKSIAKATTILDTLRLSLDYEAGGEISINLSDLYRYMSERLLEASIGNDIVKIDEVIDLLSGIKGAWDQISESDRTAAYTQMQNKTAIGE